MPFFNLACIFNPYSLKWKGTNGMTWSILLSGRLSHAGWDSSCVLSIWLASANPADSPSTQCHLASWQMCSVYLQAQRWMMWHSSTMPLQFRNLMTSCVINMKGTALTKAGDRSSRSLSTLKRKAKITPKLVIEENSSIRSNRSTVSSLSFLTSITNMKNPERPKS